MTTPLVLVELNSQACALAIGRESLRPLEQECPGLRFEYLTSYDELSRRVAEAHVVLCWQFAEELHARAPALRAVFTPSAGRDWVAADPSGRVSVHYGSFHGAMIAESLAAMMLHFNDRRTLMMRNQARHRYDRDAQMPRTLLGNQRVLFIGYGHIGRHCARLLRAFGCEMSGMQRTHDGGEDPQTGVRYITPAQLPGVLPHADHVVLLLPGGDATRGFFGVSQLSAMKPTACLYNFGRGTVVDEDALVSALGRGAIAGAGLDVFAREPLPVDSPLWDMANVVLTPHSSCMFAEYGALFAAEIAPALKGLC
jgi:D-2-hydroxyacid dehydrogenase (NADP+)